MFVKNQIPSLCKLYSFSEELPEEFFDETDVDSFFTTTFLTFHSPESFGLAEAPTKNHLQSSCSSFSF